VDTDFLIVVIVGLSLLSLMVIFRMRVCGASSRQIALLTGELWAASALWISALAGFAALRRTWLIAGLAVAGAMAAHLLWSVSRAMRRDICWHK